MVKDGVTLPDWMGAVYLGKNDAGYNVYTAERVTVKTEEELADLSAKDWFERTGVLLAAEGVSPESLGFIKAGSADGYSAYIRSEVTAVSTEFMSWLAEQEWVEKIALLYVKSRVSVPMDYSVYLAGYSGQYACYSREMLTIFSSGDMVLLTEAAAKDANLICVSIFNQAPEFVTNNFTLVGGSNGTYKYYIKQDGMRVVSQAFLDTIASETWFTSVSRYTLKDGLEIPAVITENYTANVSENGYTVYTKNITE